MSSIYDVIGTSNPAFLLADPIGADPIAVPMEPGNGTVKRGTVIYRKASALWAPAANADVTTSNMLAVLNEDVNTGTELNGDMVAEDAAAYRAGRFIDGKVTLASNATLSAANKVVLRLQGILFKVDENADEIDAGVYKITYKANNGLTGDDAEEDVVKTKVAGATYTILNNSDSSLGFTAPASKWNTKADGTGTDYAAAATYSTDADLNLYAVWA